MHLFKQTCFYVVMLCIRTSNIKYVHAISTYTLMHALFCHRRRYSQRKWDMLMFLNQSSKMHGSLASTSLISTTVTGRKKPFSPGSQQPLVPAVQPGLNMRD